MESGERVVVRKIFLGSAAKFGLLFGLVFGIIGCLVSILLTIVGLDFYNSIILSFQPNFTQQVFTSSQYIMILGISFFSLFILFFLSSIIFSLVYNLVSLIGGSLDILLVEKGLDVRTNLNKKVSKVVPPIEDKPIQMESASAKGYVPAKLSGETA